MASKSQNAKNESSRLRSLRSATNLQEFESGQVLSQDKVTQNLPGLYAKGLLQQNNGTCLPNEVDQYQLLVAMEAGDQDALQQISLGGARKLVNTQAAFAQELVGGVPYGFTMPTPPDLGSRWAACEMAEVYEMCIAADVPFTTLNGSAANTGADRAVSMLNGFGDDMKGPKDGGLVTRKLLFRGNTYGCNFGPYVSQFFMHDFNLGLNPITQKYYFETGAYGITEANFLEIQKGNKPVPQTQSPAPLRPFTPRGLASVVHVDFVYQFFYYAAQIILGAGIPRHGAYQDIYPDVAFVTNGGVVVVATAMADVTKNALTATWVHKWRNHMRLRPEEMAGRVVKQDDGVLSNLVHPDLFSVASATIQAVKDFNAPLGGEAKAWLPLNYCEGSPTHPSYPAGHATIAGACATILKMIFSDAPWANMGTFAPVYESPDGDQLTAYTGGDTAAMTLHTELNKLASNCAIGRNMAGVHYRADGDYGLDLGEKIAIQYYLDYLSRQTEPYGPITFTKFNGDSFTIPSGGGQTRAIGEPVSFERDI